MTDQARLMDRIYRLQVPVYDMTRRFILPGRDRLLGRITVRSGDRVLEAGCGTARNLIALARRHPRAAFFGLDASQKMIAYAARKVKRAGLSQRITLHHLLVEELDGDTPLRAVRPFDAAIFSYSLSMIPDCVEALDGVLASVSEGGEVAIVDFGDMRSLPKMLQRLVTWWLALFHVVPRPEILDHLAELERAGRGVLEIEHLPARYAFVAHFRKRGQRG